MDGHEPEPRLGGDELRQPAEPVELGEAGPASGTGGSAARQCENSAMKSFRL